jgi:hypothetical protein
VPSVATTDWEDCLVTYHAIIPAKIATDPSDADMQVTFDGAVGTTTFTVPFSDDVTMAAETALTISVLPKSRGLIDFTAEQLDIALTIIDPCEPYAATIVRDEVADTIYVLSEDSFSIVQTWTLTPSVDTITAEDCKGTFTATIPAEIGTTPAADSQVTFSFSDFETTIVIPSTKDFTMEGTWPIVITAVSRGGADFADDTLTINIVI